MALPTRVVTETWPGRAGAQVLFVLQNTVTDGTSTAQAGTQTIATLDNSGALSQALYCQDASLNATPIYDWRPIFGDAAWVEDLVVPAGTGSVALASLSPQGPPLTPSQFTQLDDAIIAEATARVAGDATNATAVAAETTRATAAEATLTTAVGGKASTAYVDAETTRATAAETLKVAKAGDTMSGDLAMGGHRVTGQADPVSAQDGATKAWTSAQITALVNGAPGILDTLGEIDAALQSDESAAAALAASVALKAPLASPALTGTPTVNGVPLDARYRLITEGPLSPSRYGAVGDGVTDDTAALQAWINAVVTAKGEGRLDPLTYNHTGLTVPAGAGKLSGAGVYGVYDTFASGVGNFTPTLAPWLRGSVLRCTASGLAAALDILGESSTVDLRDFGITWSNPFASTGHGIRGVPGVSKNGLAGSRWDNIQVFGHDGNSYGMYLANFAQITVSHFRAWGGGMFKLEQNNGSQYGNSTFIGVTGKLFVAGSAHVAHVAITSGNATRLGFIGCEFNALAAATSYASRPVFAALTNPTAAQLLFKSESGLRGLSLISAAFDPANSACGAPSIAAPGAHGGNFIDPGGFFSLGTSMENSGIPMISSPTDSGNGIVPFGIDPTATASGAVTLTATTSFWIRLCNAASAAFAVTLPAASASKGREFLIKKTDSSANAVTVTRAGSDLIDGATTYALSAQYKFVRVLSDGTGWQIIGAN